MMDKNQTLKSILTHLAEDAALPNEIDLWPSIQVHLMTEKYTQQKRKPEMNTNKNKRLRFAAAGVLALILALVMLFSLPQGRAWAQNILRFFTRTADQILLPTPEPVNMVGITPGVSQPTLSPTSAWHSAFYETCGDLPMPNCTLEQIDEMVNFPVKNIADLPERMQFIGATGGPDSITSVYLRNEPQSTVLLIQNRITETMQQDSLVGESAIIEPVIINGIDGEYVKGSYFVYGGDSMATWDSNVETQTLRWDEDGILYTMTMIGSIDFGPDKLDRDGLIDLAASLTDQIVLPIETPTTESPKSAAQAGEEAGFQVIEPTWLPEGYRFERAAYNPELNIVCMEYGHPADQPMGSPGNPPAPSLSIAESTTASLPDINDLISKFIRPDQVLLEESELQVGGALGEKGLYAYGSLDPSGYCGNILQHQVLEVQTEDMNITILAKAEEAGISGSSRNCLTQQEMVRLAESITGVSTIAEDQPDLEYLTSIEDANQLAVFTLKYPTKMPEGMNFSYIQLKDDGEVHTAIINYSNGNQSIQIRQTQGSKDTLDTITMIHPEAYHAVTVHQQPAILSQGYWDEDGWKEIANGGDGDASVTWFEDGIEYSVGGFNAYPSDVWLEVAESLQ